MIEIRNISKAFAGNLALDDVSFTIKPGRIHALVGENGSGKSTLIKILAGYYVPGPEASVVVDGRPLTLSSVQASHKSGLRFVHQRSSLIGEMSATDNIALNAGYVRHKSGRIDWRGSSQQARDLLASLDVRLDTSIPVGLHREVDRSSIAIARAIGLPGSDVRCIALDEPTAALPPAEVDTLKSLIQRIADSGVSILYVSHRLAEILDMATDLTVLRDGKNVFSGPTDGLTHDRLVELIVGSQKVESVDGYHSREQLNTGASNPVGCESVTRTAPRSQPSDFTYFVSGLSTRDLAGIDFAIRSGEVLGVCGLDGSGREDVVYALGGAVQSKVTVKLPDGEVIEKMNPRIAKRCGFALTLSNREPASFVGEFSIGEDLTLPSLGSSALGRFFVRRGRDSRSVDAWIKRLDIRPPRARTHVEKLSGGNQQKAIIAKWLNTTPSVMMYNDPTSGVDVGSRRSIYGLIRSTVEEGAAVVVASSDLEDLTSVCDRVLVLVAGKLSVEVVGSEISEQRLLQAMTEGLSRGKVGLK